MSERQKASTKELAVIGSIGQLLRDHAANPFEGVFSVAIRDGGYSIYYGGIATEPENAAECWLMVLEATKVLQALADEYTGGTAPAPEKPEKPQLALIKGGKGSRKSRAKVAKIPDDSAPRAVKSKAAPTAHPKPGEQGEVILINKPSKPTGMETWSDPKAIATVVPGGELPESLNGTPFLPWDDAPKSDSDWGNVGGQLREMKEPSMVLTNGKSASAGVIIEEPDGRVWIVHPTNAFGGYQATFAKGRVEKLPTQAAAIKEAYEESGLQVAITGIVGDIERTTTVARYYLGRRIGGKPSAMGWESQAVSLVPREKLVKILNQPVDHKLVAMLEKPLIPVAK